MEIAPITLRTALTGTSDTYVLNPVYARENAAKWRAPLADGPEIGAQSVVYQRRDPIKGQTDLVRHTFRVTLPTLRTVVGEGVPYEPGPELDYVSVAEISVWVNPRASTTERTAILSSVRNLKADFEGLLEDVVVDGNQVY